MTRKTIVVWVLALVFGLAPAAFAQLSTGNIYGTVTDESGAVLPGVAVTLTGDFGTRETVTDAEGRYRFLRVDHGTHTLTASMTGFSGMTRDVVITVGSDITIDFTMKVAAVEEVLTITAETPLVDTKKTGTDLSVKKDELNRVPTAREPWALMRTVPGILVDRVNLAGSESGQQSGFYGKGSSDKDQTWTIDGVVVTDEVSWSSPTYFNYDSIDEINFSTGGQDVSVATGGIGINIVTKRGTNAFHGGATGFFTHDDLQSSNLPDALVGDERLQGSDKADHTEQIADWSVHLGGPIIKDKLWFFGVYGRNDIRIRTLTQTQDRTILENTSAKLNWQAGPNDMISLMYFNGAKSKYGRRSGSLQQSDSHLYNQSGTHRDGWLDGLSKVEWNHVFGPDFMANAKYAFYNTGFVLTPRGGLDQRGYFDYVNGLAYGSNSESQYLRPQWTANLDMNYFAGNHDVRFGAAYRRTAYDYKRTTPGPGQLIVNFRASGIDEAQFYRDADIQNRVEHWSAYAGDTFIRDRWTINASVRWDRYNAFSLPTAAVANEAIPELLPDLKFAGSNGDVVVWNNVVPRLGLTYALGDDRKTVLRGSFSMYTGLLGAWTASWDNPVGTSYLRYEWNDANGDRDVQLDEVNFDNLLRASNIDPNNPAQLGESPNKYDPDYGANRDYEVIAGIEHEMAPNLALSAAYTFRRATNIGYQGHSYWYPWLDDSGDVFGASDFYPVTQTIEGRPFTTYELDDAAWDRVTFGLLMTNAPGYTQTFNGVELSLIKRMSDRWMGRLAFSYNMHEQGVGPEGIVDPTPTIQDTLEDGGIVAPYATGSGVQYFVNAKWQLNVNGMVQLPKGFEFSGNLFGRQGYPNPNFARISHGIIGTSSILPDNEKMGDERFPDLWNLDLRLANRVPIGDEMDLTISAELFNVFNSNTLLVQTRDLSSSAYNRIDQILAPRILRFGVRFSF